MKRTIVFVLFVIVIIGYTYSQEEKIFIQKSYQKYITVDGSRFYTIGTKKRSIYLNDKAIDSLGSRLYCIIHYKNTLIGLMERKGRYYVLKPNSKTIVDVTGTRLNFNLLYTENNLFGLPRIYYDSIEKIRVVNKIITEGEYLNNVASPYSKRLYKMNPYTGKQEELLFDLDKFFKDSINGFTLSQVTSLFELDNYRLFITTVFCGSGCEYYDHFVYDFRTKSVKQVNYLKDWEQDNTFYHVEFYMKDSSSKHYLGEFSDYDVRNKSHSGAFIFDENLKVICRALPHNTTNIGFNIKSQSIVSYNLISTSDANQEFVLSYKFNLPTERSFYKIYSNEVLLNADLNLMSKEECNIIKHMIYAKHNYKFSDPFYQAYFNLFDFYNSSEKRNKRLAKVDHLFTSIDKKNLEAINKLLLKR